MTLVFGNFHTIQEGCLLMRYSTSMRAKKVIGSMDSILQGSGLQSKIRHLQSLDLSMILLKIITLKSKRSVILFYFFRLFSLSNDEEAKLLSGYQGPVRDSKFSISLKNTLFVGLVIRVNIRRGKSLSLLDRLYLSILLRRVPIQSILLISRMTDLFQTRNLKMSPRVRKSVRYFHETHQPLKVHFGLTSLPTRNVQVNSRGIIFDRKGHSYFSDPSVKREILTNAGLHNLLVRCPDMDLYAYFAKKNFQKIKSISGSCLVLTSRCSSNYWHFLLEDAVRLNEFKKKHPLMTLSKIAVSEDMVEMGSQIISFIYPGVELITISDDQLMLLEEILIPSSELVLDDSPSFDVSHTFRYNLQAVRTFRDEILLKKKSVNFHYGSKIYIRRNSGHRVINGEQELIIHLIELGFSVIDAVEFEFVDQAQIFEDATVLIGLAGAAWANLIFCKEGTRVLSIIGEDASPWDMHQVIADDLGLNYKQYVVHHSAKTDLFYTNFLHRDVVLFKEDVSRIIEWVNSEDVVEL
jgi:capsular polysaccharide biosynthesis protein